jgi:opacity protein-like surface antigen
MKKKCFICSTNLKHKCMKMKCILLVIAFSIAGYSNVKSQIVEEGNVVIDIYYGWPNLFSVVAKNFYADDDFVTGLKVSSVGPIALRFEYMLSDKVGIGADLGYVNTMLEWKETDNISTYYYELSIPKITALLRMNFHFSQSDKLDAYGTFGVGYRSRTIKWKTNDPFFVDDKTKSIIPVGARLGIGLRYFFTDNIGLGAEMGLGGPLLSFGLSARF